MLRGHLAQGSGRAECRVAANLVPIATDPWRCHEDGSLGARTLFDEMMAVTPAEFDAEQRRSLEEQRSSLKALGRLGRPPEQVMLRSASCLWAPHPPGTVPISSYGSKILYTQLRTTSYTSKILSGYYLILLLL